MSSETLKKELERVRFEHAMEVTESLADRHALLTATELGRMNIILIGKERDPWRKDPVTLTLPSGKKETLTLIADPRLLAREKLHCATEKAESGNVIDAAADIYISLVLAHVFKDANRRTAVLATHYFLRRYGIPLSGITLHETKLGDLREKGQAKALRDTIRQMSRFAEKRLNNNASKDKSGK